MIRFVMAVAAAVILSIPSGAEEMTKRVLIFGDSNSWGAEPIVNDALLRRLPTGHSYPELTGEQLGGRYNIIIDAMPDRTTNLDVHSLASNGLGAADFNGAAGLPAALSRSQPLDLVVIMLGTNDLTTEFERSADDIAVAATMLAQMVENGAGYETAYAPASVLLIAPPPLGPVAPPLAETFVGAQDKSQGFGRAYTDHAKAAGIEVLDAGAMIGVTAGADGVHLSAEQHAVLATAVADKIKSMLE